MKRKKAITMIMAVALAISLLTINVIAAASKIAICVEVNSFGSSNVSSTATASGGTSLILSAGTTTTTGGALRLTDNAGTQAGTAVRRQPITLTSSGFSTYFVMRMYNPSYDTWNTSVADGMSFYVRETGYTSVGATGEGIGYDGMDGTSYAVEFDTYHNANKNDPNSPHVAIDTNGSATHSSSDAAWVKSDTSIYNSTLYVWVDFDGVNGILYVHYTTTEPSSGLSGYPSNATTVSRYVGTGLVGKSVNLGFSASTGGSMEYHDVYKWYFQDSYDSSGLTADAGSYEQGPTTVGITTTKDAGGNVTTANVKEYIAGTATTGDVKVYVDGAYKETRTITTASSGVDFDVSSLNLSAGSHTIYAVSADGGATSDTTTFTQYASPTLTTSDASAYGVATATVGGSVSSSGGSTLTDAGVYYGTDADPASTGRKVSTGTSTSISASLTSLSPGTKYYYAAYATNSVGTSYGSVKSFTTYLASPSVSVSADTNSLSASWNSITNASSYDIYLDNGSSATTNVTGTSYTYSGLNPNTQHSIKVVAKNSVSSSTGDSFTSKYTLAAQPSVTTATPKQNGSVVLTIDTAANSAATTYLIEKSQKSDFSSGVTTVMSYATLSGTTVTVPKNSSDENAGVLSATTYYFRITAKNGDTVTTTLSATATGCLTVPEIPDAPTLTAAETNGYGAKQILLDWNDVTGASSYDIYKYSSGTYTYLGTSTTSEYTDADLTPNTQYTYAVVSRNAGTSGSNDDGRSVYSAIASKYTFAVTPDADTVTANVDGSVSVTVDEQTNPTDATYYYVQASESSDFSSIKTSSDWVNPSSDHRITITGLDRGTTYYFRVKAENNESTPVETTYGDIVGSVTTIPANVGGTVAVTATGTTSLSVSWSTSTGATSYDVYYSEDGSTFTYLKNVTGTSTSDAGLAPNTGRYYKVISRNSSGVSTGALASAAKVYTYAVIPALTLTPQSDGTILVSIAANGNSNATTYYVEYGTAYSGTSLTSVSGSSGYDTSTSRTISGLDSNTVYYFHVKAKNGGGVETSYSGIVNVLSVPATPVISSAVPSVSGTTHSVTVEWADLGTGITYNVYRGGTLLVTTSGTSYEDSGLKANKSYQYTVAAINDGGVGTASSALSARTLAEYPDAVTASSKTASAFTITLTPSSILAEAEQYQVTLKTAAGATVTALSWSSDLSYKFSGLSSDTQYVVYVNIRNSDGVERGAKSMLTLYTNRAVNGEITNDAADIVLENDSSSSFTIQMKLWDPDGDRVTATATIGGITRTVTVSAPASEPDSYNAELVWDSDTLVEGTYSDPITVTLTDGNDSTITLSYDHDLIVDKTAPVITLTGDATVYLEVGNTYTDGGATVTGDDGNGVSSDTSRVDTETAGTYTVTYTSTDDAGNTTTATRTVIVVDPVSASTVTLAIPESGIGATSAVLDGAVTTLGKQQTFSDHGFVWSTAAIAGSTHIVDSSVTKISLGSKSNLDTFTTVLTGLSSGTYYVRPYVVYNGSVIYGSEVSFTTPDSDTNRLYLSPTAITRTEGDSGTTDVTFTVSRLAADMSASVDVPIDFSGTAAEGTDYTTNLTSGTVTIGENETSATVIVSIKGNMTYEPDKTVVMALGSVADYTSVAGNDSATLTISNDDAYVAGSDATISNFSLGVSGEQVLIDSANTVGTISITVPYGTDISSITPDIMLTDSVNASITPAGVRDFSVGTVAYIVTAEDGTTKRYEVNTTVEPASTDATLCSAVFTYGEGSTIILTPGFDSSTTDGYAGDVSSDTESISLSAVTTNSGATKKAYLDGTEVKNLSDIALAYGDNTITIVITAESGATKTYTFMITRAAAGTDSNADLVSIVLSHGTLDPDFDKDTTEYNVNVANSIATTAITVTLSNSGASYAITANGTATTAGTEASLEVGANVFVVTVTATDGTVKTYSISVSRAKAASSGGGGGSSSSASAASHVPVIINGTTVSAGTQTSGTASSGATTTTVIVDTSLVDTQLSSAGSGATVTVPISGDETIKTGVLTGAMVKQMEDQGATLQVTTGDVTYVIPANEINVDDAADTFGSNVALSDINVTVQIESLTGTEAKFVAETTAGSGYTLMLQPVTFTVTAEHNGTTVEIDTFKNYVQRLVAIPDYVNADKITTAVVVTSSGTYHVPTEVKEIDGSYYAVINSLTNSTYALIYNTVTFSDTVGHWAEDAINDMGARTVVNGVGNNLYKPDRSITRAEFSVIIVRALGLNTGMGASEFTDVSSADWFYGYAQTAVSYGLINGYSDGTFKPNDTITREQAMTIIARAMQITGLAPTLTDSEVEALLSTFTDASDISSYAKKSIAACVDTRVVFGKADGTVAANDSITRAEVAVIVERLLQKSNLI